MALTQEAVSSLRAKIEPRPHCTMTETGLQKAPDGSLIARHSTEDGSRTPEQTMQAIEEDEARMEELMALREQQQQEEQPKKRTRKKAASAPAPVQPPQPKLRQITITIPGFGGIPSQYTHVYIGEGIAILGLSSMSFQPQGPDPQTGAPSSTLELSANPGVKYVYLGNSFVDGHNTKNLLLVEVPEGEQ